MPAPLLNQNAAKPGPDRASSFLHIRAIPHDKAGWVKAANKQKIKLAAWVTETLNQASQVKQ